MKKILISFLAVSLLLTACNKVQEEKPEEQEQTYTLTAVTAENLQDNMFYVKTGDQFYPIHMGETTISENNLIAKEVNPERIISFAKDDVMIPTMYKDDSLIYYTTSQVPTFTWERLKDHGYSVGLYNLKPAESGKVEFVVGESKTNHTSDAYKGLSQLNIGDSVLIIDKIAGQSLDSERLSECGSITGLKTDELANFDIYIGTNHHLIESTVDTHIFSSMELYQTTEYNLMPEGYASVKIPDYFMSGYYFINGVGVVRYVDNNRSEGIPNIDFSVPYFYFDENGKQITLEEYNKLNGKETEDEVKVPDYEFTYDIDSTVKSFEMKLKYDLLEDEDPTDILYIKPTAKIISPIGEETEFELKKEEDKQVLSALVNGVMSGTWKVEVYDLKERKFNIETNVTTGNADSFIHSGNTSGKITIHSDGISGSGIATIKWENATHAANIEIKSPSGTIYSDTVPELMILDGYGEKQMMLNEVEAGSWELTITGEDLGRCWFTISKQEEQPAQPAQPEQSEESTEASQEESIPEEITIIE